MSTADRFRATVESWDLEGMVALLAPDVRLHSPAKFRPFVGRAAVRAEIGPRAVAYVGWKLNPQGEVTTVELTTTVTSAGLVDRLLRAFGGRLWPRRRMAATLAALAVLIAPTAL
jgi:hypothetical protein